MACREVRPYTWLSYGAAQHKLVKQKSNYEISTRMYIHTHTHLPGIAAGWHHTCPEVDWHRSTKVNGASPGVDLHVLDFHGLSISVNKKHWEGVCVCCFLTKELCFRRFPIREIGDWNHNTWIIEVNAQYCINTCTDMIWSYYHWN